ncbi:MAG: HIT family protein [Candidatus Izimaplasma sp.]|nr:HIT family protein [Candidatus Izimaplasma bacterium]
MVSCIFCKIRDGEIPSYKIYEDDKVLAFLDITQATKGHTLIIPKRHVKNVFDLPEDVAADLFRRIPKIANALKNTFNPIGLNIINNNDKPLQSVFHYHVHLVPRYEKDEMVISFPNHMKDYDEKDYQALVNQVKINI